MKQFMLLHLGFEKPTPEIMQKWHAWFDSIRDRQLDQAGFASGREISAKGTKELGWDPDCLTGYNIIEAESLEEAEQIAAQNPWVSGIRVYELRRG